MSRFDTVRDGVVCWCLFRLFVFSPDVNDSKYRSLRSLNLRRLQLRNLPNYLSGIPLNRFLSLLYLIRLNLDSISKTGLSTKFYRGYFQGNAPILTTTRQGIQGVRRKNLRMGRCVRRFVFKNGSGL